MATDILKSLVTMIEQYEAEKGKIPVECRIYKSSWEKIMKLPIDIRRKHINFVNRGGTPVVSINNVPVLVNGNYIPWSDYING